MSNLDEFAIVVPFRQSCDRPDAAARLCSLFSYIRRLCPGSLLIVSDQTSILPIGAGVTLTYRRKWVWDPRNVYSPSPCKNAGARLVDRDYVLFLDLDVLPTVHLIREMRNLVKDKREFIWFPVHFLTESAPTFRTLSRSNLLRLNLEHHIDQVGYATGIQAFSREFFISTGGYDEAFVGYGCEDIEMLHRCSLLLGWLRFDQMDAAYREDYRTKKRAEYRGFRRTYAEIIEKQLNTSELYAFHIWHNRRTKRRYRKMRSRNDEILLERLRQGS